VVVEGAGLVRAGGGRAEPFALIVILIVLSLLPGGFRERAKVSWARPAAPLAAAQHPSPRPR